MLSSDTRLDESVSSIVHVPNILPANTTQDIRIAHLNCRSLPSSIDDIHVLMLNDKIDVLTLSETWLDESISDQEICPDVTGLHIIRRDRNRRGGGVAIMLSRRMKYKHRPDISEGKIESIWIELFPNSKRAMNICCTYRPPSQYDFYEHLSDECESILPTGHAGITILGDLNSDLLNPALQQTKRLNQLIGYLQLDELVKQPTRITQSTSTQLDVILTNRSECFKDTFAIPYSNSDHHLVATHFYPRGVNLNPKHKVIFSRKYSNLDVELLDCILMDEVWKDILSFDNIDDCVKCFNLVMEALIDMMIPLRKIRIKGTLPPWSNDASITSMRRFRDKLHRKAIQSGNTDDWREYKRIRNKTTSMTRLAKGNYIARLSTEMKDKPSKFWRYVDHLSNRNKSFQLKTDNTANDFNQYFLSVSQQIVNTITPSAISPTSFLCQGDIPKLEFSLVEIEEVVHLIRQMSSNKATGADKIPTRLLKSCPMSFGVIITELINRSISTNTFPTQWKKAIVTPIPKSTQNDDLTNFRPISVLPVISKILERVISNQLVSHMLQNDLLSDSQSGFRSGHSTQDVLLYVTERWRKAIDEGKYVGVGFLDLTKAFDCVNHKILLSKAAYFGIQGPELKWMESYLSGRSQQVSLNGALSESGNIVAGVPQGSILGPLLFTMYTNDIPRVIQHCSISMYADDTEIHYDHRDISEVEEKIQSDLNQLEVWMASNKLKLNVNKSSVMLIGSRQRIRDKSLKVSIYGSQLEQVTRTRYLGLLIDNHLTWDDHISGVLNRVRHKLNAIGRLKPLPPRILSLLYQSFVVPIFDYCDIVWSPSSRVKAEQLERLHRRATRLIPAKKRGFSLHHTLADRRVYHMMIATYKIIKNVTPVYLRDLLRATVDVTQHLGRNIHRLFIPSVRTNYGKNSFYFRAAMTWNSLNTNLYTAPNLDTFKALYAAL